MYIYTHVYISKPITYSASQPSIPASQPANQPNLITITTHPQTTHRTQHTTHNTQDTQDTPHNTQLSILNTQHTTHNTQHTTHNTHHIIHNTQHTTHPTQHPTTYNKPHTTHNTLLSARPGAAIISKLLATLISKSRSCDHLTASGHSYQPVPHRLWAILIGKSRS